MASYEVKLVTPDGEKVFRCDENAYLLETAEANGIALPSTCLQGWCITCAGRIQSGQVDQSEAVRFYRQDGEAGFVLLCCAYPRSDLTILTHQKGAMREHRVANGLPAPMG